VVRDLQGYKVKKGKKMRKEPGEYGEEEERRMELGKKRISEKTARKSAQ